MSAPCVTVVSTYRLLSVLDSWWSRFFRGPGWGWHSWCAAGGNRVFRRKIGNCVRDPLFFLLFLQSPTKEPLLLPGQFVTIFLNARAVFGHEFFHFLLKLPVFLSLVGL